MTDKEEGWADCGEWQKEGNEESFITQLNYPEQQMLVCRGGLRERGGRKETSRKREAGKEREKRKGVGRTNTI